MRLGASNSPCPGGEIGRRTGLKILGLERVVPVQVWPGAPTLQSLNLFISQVVRAVFFSLVQGYDGDGAAAK